MRPRAKANTFVLSFLNFEFFNFSLKEETLKNIHNKDVAELVHYIIVSYMQELGTCSGNTGILLWH